MQKMKNSRAVQAIVALASAGTGYGFFEGLNNGFRDTICPPCNVTNVTTNSINDGTPLSPIPETDCISPENFTRMMVGTALATMLAVYFLYLLFTKCCCRDQREDYEQINDNSKKTR